MSVIFTLLYGSTAIEIVAGSIPAQNLCLNYFHFLVSGNKANRGVELRYPTRNALKGGKRFPPMS